MNQKIFSVLSVSLWFSYVRSIAQNLGFSCSKT